MGRTASSRRTLICMASTRRNGNAPSSGRSLHASTWTSSRAASSLTVERLKSRPHSSSVIRPTFRVLTPFTTISSMASTSAFSLRW